MKEDKRLTIESIYFFTMYCPNIQNFVFSPNYTLTNFFLNFYSCTVVHKKKSNLSKIGAFQSKTLHRVIIYCTICTRTAFPVSELKGKNMFYCPCQ